MANSSFNLKIIIIAYLLQEIVTSTENKFFTPNKNALNCSSILIEFKSDSHTLIVIEMNNTNIKLSDCMPSLHARKSLIFFNEDSKAGPATLWKLSNRVHSNPPIIIFTATLRKEILLHPVLQILFQSHWSLVTIVIDAAKYKCEEDNIHAYDVIIENFLNHLWHTYQIFYVVLHLPHACPELFITYDEKKWTNRSLYDRTITAVLKNDLENALKKSVTKMTAGYPLKLNIFYRFPTAITHCKNHIIVKFNKTLTNGYCGIDALVMHDVITMFNFNVSFPIFDKNVGYGYAAQGKVTGSLGGVVRGDIDVSFNARFFVLYVENGFQFLNYISHDHLCALMKEPEAVPLWFYPFNVYIFERWMLNACMLVILGLIISIKIRISSILFRETVLKTYIYVINTMWAGLFGFFMHTKIHRSLLTALCLLESIVFMAKYQGHINYMFATLIRYNKLVTLNDMQNNNIQIYTTPAISMLLGYKNETSNSPKSKLLRNLKYYPSGYSTTEYVLEHPDRATLERRIDMQIAILVNYTDNNDRPMIYVVNECIQGFYLSYIVRLGFPFTRPLQKFLTRMVEAGLPDKYYKWSRYMITLRENIEQPVSEPRPPTKISLSEQRVAFGLLMIGYIVSIIVFIIEMCRGKHVCNKIHNRQIPYID